MQRPTDWESFLENLRKTLYEQLHAASDRTGFNEEAIRKLISAVLFVPFDEEEPLFARANEDDLVYFLVRGAVRVTLGRGGKKSLIMSITPPGQFILSGSYFQGSGRHHRFGAEAHIPSWVAVWSETVIAEVLTLLPDARKVRLMRCPWVGFSSQLELAHTLRTLPLRDQLLLVFRTQARNFGIRQPNGWWLIQLPLGIDDLARLTGCARTNVSRRLKSLQREGLVKRVAKKHWMVRDEVVRSRAD